MKKGYLALTLGIMLLGAGSLKAAGSFEGVVNYNLTMKDGTGTMDYMIKEKKIRMNMVLKGRASDVIMDMDTKQMIMMMPQQKMYMAMSIPDTQKAQAHALASGKLTKTGNTEVIAGKTAEEWLYQSEKGTSSIWAASGMGVFMGMSSKPNDANSAWTEAVKKNGLFPLKVVSKDKDGKMVMTMEATKMTPQTVDPGVFVPPSDYHKMDMGFGAAMMGGKMPGQ